MILVDTSAWIEFQRASGNRLDLRVAELLRTNAEVGVTEPITMEVLAGARSDADEWALRRLLLRFELLAFEPAADFEGAARIYRRCRSAGFTPGGLLDCMIISVAWRFNATLLTNDSGLMRMAQVVGVELDPACSAKE